MSTIRSAWESYDRNVVPKDAGEVQRKETRRAFFAGAHALRCMFLEIGDTEDATEADRKMVAIIGELADFHAGIGRGN